tara:strand:+ start:744 stop:1481 length:738 start_codon:yes stop_codon:yes gene_type:complete
MGNLALTILAQENQPPSQIGWLSLSLPYNGTHVFTLANFTTETNPVYADPENDSLSSIKITNKPVLGELTLNNIAVNVNDIITVADLNNGVFEYTCELNYSSGYDDGYFRYTAADTGSLEYINYSRSISFLVEDDLNSAPSSVGDGEADLALGRIFTFTEASLTSNLNPPYADPENNPPYRLLITSLPLFGSLKLSGNDVVVNQEIDWANIQGGNLTYENESLPTEGIEGFEFMISDTGSQQYTG